MKSLVSLSGVLLALLSPALASVTVTSPASNAAVSSPVNYVATASSSCAKGVASIGVYVNNQRVVVQNGANLNASVPLSNGTYSTVVQEWDNCGDSTTAPVNITVGSQTGTATAVVVSSPANNTTVSSPVTFSAKATTAACASGIGTIGVYVDNVLAYKTSGAVLQTSLVISPGTHYTVAQAWDNCGGAIKTPVTITVAPVSAATVSISASPTSITSGGSSVLSVTASNATQIAVTGSNGTSYNLPTTGGQQTVSPTATTTYTATASGASGKVTSTATVTVGATTTAVVVSSPSNNSTVSSPVTFSATATTAICASGIAAIGVYVDNVLAYKTNGVVLQTALAISTGKHSTVIQAWDNCGGAIKTPVTITVQAGSAPVSSIAVTPANASVTANSTLQLTATASYTNKTTGDVTSTATWTSANTAVATVSTDGLVTGVAAGSTTITAALNGVSGTGPLAVTVASASGVNISTWHVDNNRSGLNANEQTLSPAKVTPSTFGKLFSYLVDGYVYGEPLLMSNITVNGSAHNVLYAATEHDSVYAFDADNYGNGTPLWQVSLLNSGETPLTAGAIQPYQGVTSTPVIDPSSNTIYVVSAQTSTANGSTFRLNALDITTGAQKPGSPVTIQASVPGTNSAAVNGITSLTTSCVQRAALLLANGTVYIGFGGCHSGWLLAYDEQKLTQTGVFNVSPNLNGEGTYASAGGIWMGSGGPVADSAGNVYVATGNGPWDGQTAWSDSVLKFNSKLQLLDYFTPSDYAYMNCNDADLAAGGLLLIPGTTQALAGGKTGKLFLINTANLGHEQAEDTGATQTLWFESDLVTPYATSCTDSAGTHPDTVNSYENFGTAAYFNGAVYLGVTPTGANVPAGVRQFLYSGTLTPSTNTTPSIQESSYGTTPFISADGTANGILWMIDHGLPLQNNHATPTDATLRAYDINNLTNEIYNSGTNSADAPGLGIKFTSPIVANGKVYISTGHDQVTSTNPQGELDVYGLK
jgi:hypothetical protein